jgi:hypothetical protein
MSIQILGIEIGQRAFSEALVCDRYEAIAPGVCSPRSRNSTASAAAASLDTEQTAPLDFFTSTMLKVNSTAF